ncbi:ABC transporter ATP-binding protein [Arthrobacter sp. ERGS1:01]|uniref:ABC transporter ATP-binding protein n=1 Tax=Arthrobacter sp. ERGS1:01 TaxID=1704044 RepID=UPI0009EBF1A3|nr:nitrate/sulfonate/bicarbonate ABC transporter ATP-binding protein [Arthrobacter sp. ERGS1:01]
MNTTPKTLINVSNVGMDFATDGGHLTVLDDVSLRVNEGEIVALLGRSGSGKSTLLRCIAGLASPTSGTVSYKGEILNGANPGVAMVFQSFALLPWLTVQENVELGLQARGVPSAERRERALRAIDMIGLDGFETAYPKELSGGMRQRVGFARALVVEPDLLLMDEPFSALDVLTSENLRGELIRLWNDGTFPTRSALIVTHNIEEAIQLADRVLVLDSNPGRIKAELSIELAHPRDRRSPAFEALVDQVYGILTGQASAARTTTPATPFGAEPTEIQAPLPKASTGELGGLLELLNAGGGNEGLAEIADQLRYELDDLLPLVDAAQLLKLAYPQDGRLRLSEQGRRYAAADVLRAKEQFATLAVEQAPLVRSIVRQLRHSDDGALRSETVLAELRRGYSDDDARAQLDTAIDWGRYAELYEYDADSERLLLPTHPDAAMAGQPEQPAAR